MVPEGCLLIAESGILGDEDVRYLKETGANGFLIRTGSDGIGESEAGGAPLEEGVPGSMKQSSMPKIKVCGLTRPEEAGMLARNRIEYAGMGTLLSEE